MLRIYGKVRQVIKTTHNEVIQYICRLFKPLFLCLKDEFLYILAALKGTVCIFSWNCVSSLARARFPAL
jgi:hypothetical protein